MPILRFDHFFVHNFLPLFFYKKEVTRLIFVPGDKPHSCELCNKKFALACNLRAHMKTHEGKFQEIIKYLRLIL